MTNKMRWEKMIPGMSISIPISKMSLSRTTDLRRKKWAQMGQLNKVDLVAIKAIWNDVNKLADLDHRRQN